MVRSLFGCYREPYSSFANSSPKWIRGTVVSTYQWAITIGLLLAAIVNNGTKDLTTHASWQVPTGLQFAWALILAGGMAALPEVSKLGSGNQSFC